MDTIAQNAATRQPEYEQQGADDGDDAQGAQRPSQGLSTVHISPQTPSPREQPADLMRAAAIVRELGGTVRLDEAGIASLERMATADELNTADHVFNRRVEDPQYYGEVEYARTGTYAKFIFDASVMGCDGDGEDLVWRDVEKHHKKLKDSLSLSRELERLTDKCDRLRTQIDRLKYSRDSQMLTRLFTRLEKLESDLKKVQMQVDARRRGTIGGFSQKSRRNMLRTVAKLDDGTYRKRPLLFITLTYPDEYDDNPETWKRDLDTFQKRLRRRHEEMAFIWRMELKVRKSGSNEGKIAPHFHLIVFNFDEVAAGDPAKRRKKTVLRNFRQWISSAWTETVGGDENHLRVGVNTEFVKGARQVRAYIAKYCAKLDEEEKQILSELGQLFEGVGRYWGIYNRKRVPWSECIKIAIHCLDQRRVWSFFRSLAGIPDDAPFALPSIAVFIEPERLSNWLKKHNIQWILRESGSYYA